MSWPIHLVLGVCVFTAHSAVLRTKDATLSRIIRSPHYGSSYHHDDFDLPPPPHGPPPPPIVYHTQNWSGVAKGIGGTPQGVFSGAAASAQGGAPADSEAFSIAASGTVPVPSDEGGQVKENIGKSGFGSHSNYGDCESHHSSGSLDNKHGSYSHSSEGQYNIKSSGLELGDGVTGSGSDESENQSGQYSGTGSDRKFAGAISAGHGSSTGQYKPADYDRESGQRSLNSDFSGQSFGSGTYSRQNGQYGSFKGFDEKESGSKFGSGSLTSGNSAGNAAADFGGQIQTSNKGRLADFNGQTGQYADASSGFGSKSRGTGSAGSANQFGQHRGQSSGSGYQPGGGNAGFDSHGGSYGARREFVSHGSYGGPHSDPHDDIHRHGKSHHENYNFDQRGDGQIGNKKDAGQGFAENGPVHSSGFSNLQSSSFGSNRGNYGSGLGVSEVGYSGSQGKIDSAKSGTGLSGNQGGAQVFSGTQHVKQLGQLDTGASQADSQALSGIQSQSSSGASGFGYNKDSGSSKIENKEAIDTGNGNGGIPSEGSLSEGVSASGQEDIQSTFGSALNLASQGLQTAQRTPCRTCDKGSYALSNAKSGSGSAIALSIGG